MVMILILKIIIILLLFVVVTHSASDWIQLGGDIDGETVGDQSGYSVSLSGDGTRVAIGAKLNDDGGSDSGHVRVFEYDSSTWVQLGGDIDGEAVGDKSGISVALSSDGSRIAIGARLNDDRGSDSGHVRVLEYASSIWVQVGDDIDGESNNDLSGHSVSLSRDGTRVAIGAPGSDDGGWGHDYGHVRVFEYHSATWVQVGDDIDGKAKYDRSGYSVSLSHDGTRVAVGSPHNDGGGSNAGHVRVFDYDSTSWVQVGGDIDGEASGDESGHSVSLCGDGSRVAIGAVLNANSGVDAGHVRVFEFDSSIWYQVGGDIAGKAAGDQSGYSVSLSDDGNRVGIGAPYNKDGGVEAGHVRLYYYDNFTMSWSQMGADLNGSVGYDVFGHAVSLSGDGDKLAVGSYGSNSNAGQVRVWHFISTPSGDVSAIPSVNPSNMLPSPDWVQLGGDIDGEAPYDYSGYSVSLSGHGSRVAVGTPNSDLSGDNAGLTRVYEYNMSSWVQVGGDISGETVQDQSGFSISISHDGSRVATGAPYNDGGGLNAGHVRVYEYDSSAWVQIGGDIDGDAAGDYSGWNVCLSSNGSRVAIGAYHNSDGSHEAGHVRIFELNSSAWVQVGNDIDGESGGDQSGSSLSLSEDGTRVAIGSPYNDGGGSDAGHVRVYEYHSSMWVQVGGNMNGKVAGDKSGISVSLSADGSRVAIGAPYNSDGGEHAGQVRVYEYKAPNWVQVAGDINGEAKGDQCGFSVSLSRDGTRVATGSRSSHGQGTYAGHVSVFEFINSSASWSQIGQNINGVIDNGYSGNAVSLSSDGSHLAVGAQHSNSGKGQVRMWQLVGAITEYPSLSPSCQSTDETLAIMYSPDWVQLGENIDGDAYHDNAGSAVSLSGNGTRVAVGARYNDGGGSVAGHVKVYQYDSYTWVQVGGDIIGKEDGDRSGWSVSLTNCGTRVAVGAPYNADGGVMAGHVRVFEYDTSTWAQLGNDIVGGAARDQSGFALSFSDDGTLLAVGAPYNDNGGSEAGHVRVYEYVSSSWVQVGGDINGEAGGENCGWSVALSANGSRVAVGAPHQGDGSSDTGHVRVYEYMSSGWSQIGGDINGENPGDSSGWAVSMSSDGTRVAIGAPYNDDGGSDSGQVRVYEYDTSSWFQVGSDIDGEAVSDRSGYSVSISGNGTRLAVGAYLNDGEGADAGHVKVYEYDRTLSCWTQLGNDIDGNDAGGGSGYAVSISNNGGELAIGAFNTNSGSGQVRIWHMNLLALKEATADFNSSLWCQPTSQPSVRPAVNWAQAGESIMRDTVLSGGLSLSGGGNHVVIGGRSSDGNTSQVTAYNFTVSAWVQLGSDIVEEFAGYNIGSYVSMSSDSTRVAIGALYDDDGVLNAGRVRVYAYNNSSWFQIGDDIMGEVAGDMSGYSVSMSSDGKRVAVGAPGNGSGGTYAGQVRVFEYDSTSWIQIGSNINGKTAGDRSGFSVSLSGDGKRLAVGAPYNDGGGSDAGHVLVYEYNFTSWVQLGGDIDGEAAQDYSGWSVALSDDGSRVAVGAPYSDHFGSDSGIVRIFEYISSAWIQMGSDIGGSAPQLRSGWSVSLSGSGMRIAVGDNSMSDSAGNARVYDYSATSDWSYIGLEIDDGSSLGGSRHLVSLSADGGSLAVDSSNYSSGLSHVTVWRATYNEIGTEPSTQPPVESTVSPSTRPSSLPSAPSSFPSARPSAPSSEPSVCPSGSPSARPSTGPTAPSGAPTVEPTARPSVDPSALPSTEPSFVPIGDPTGQPSTDPTSFPTWAPSGQPSTVPSVGPSGKPTSDPSAKPSRGPSAQPSFEPSAWPSGEPSGQPSSEPSSVPSAEPSRQPSSDPTANPSGRPSGQPSTEPSARPSGVPTADPTRQPSGEPSGQPSVEPSSVPSGEPSGQPSTDPSARPSLAPSGQPSTVPSVGPSGKPTSDPSAEPSGGPSGQPSTEPSAWPSGEPSGQPSSEPSSAPSAEPSGQPSSDPTANPSGRPSGQPSTEPSARPSGVPTADPTRQPSGEPSGHPSVEPTSVPIGDPSGQPSTDPSARPSLAPSGQPSTVPSVGPSGKPTSDPSAEPSGGPSSQPSSEPSAWPSGEPSGQPSSEPSSVPSAEPSGQPSSDPTANPSGGPSGQPSTEPSARSSSVPTADPTRQPSGEPSGQPSVDPTSVPIGDPSGQPSTDPSARPSLAPSGQPSTVPSVGPSGKPTSDPSAEPSGGPSGQPSTLPSAWPSDMPTSNPTAQPSGEPSGQPSSEPSSVPSAEPSGQPSSDPSANPSGGPSGQPSTEPSARPSGVPTADPTRQPSGEPSAQPSTEPTSVPSGEPSGQPSTDPSARPSGGPSGQPSTVPSVGPSDMPTSDPTPQPSGNPSRQPSTDPTANPSGRPSGQPSNEPSAWPSGVPTSDPTSQPSVTPSGAPSGQPTIGPSAGPSVAPTSDPSAMPSMEPSGQPSSMPSYVPSGEPSGQPSSLPSCVPSGDPSGQPSNEPSSRPSGVPSSQPSITPSAWPSGVPTLIPSSDPSVTPSGAPTGQPSIEPSSAPSGVPTSDPSAKPSAEPSGQPSTDPSAKPSGEPSGQPSVRPSGQPSCDPSTVPTTYPTTEPSGKPSGHPSAVPSVEPTGKPSGQPTTMPSAQPSGDPTGLPTSDPSALPSRKPSTQPSADPTGQPSPEPSSPPSSHPTCQPSKQPTCQPSDQPSHQPTIQPTSQPSGDPTAQPSMEPSSLPSGQPSCRPSLMPSGEPSSDPSVIPSIVPSASPSRHPTAAPVPTITAYPTLMPSYTVLPTSSPSSNPSISPLTLWNGEVLRFDKELTSLTGKQAVYFDLIVKQQRVMGSCRLWKNFADDEMSTYLVLHKAASISMTSVVDLNADFHSRTHYCNSSNVAVSIVEYFNVMSQSSVTVDESTSFKCGDGNVWTIGKCHGAAAPYICVNCNAPCLFSSSMEYWKNISSIMWFNTSCQSNDLEIDVLSRESLFRTIVIDFEELSVAPDIVNVTAVSPAKDMIEVTVTLEESSGALVCGAYSSVPLNVEELQLRHQLLDITGMISTFIIGGLRASSSYYVYCATYSSLNVPMTYTKMLDTRTMVRTACCRHITVEILQPTVYGHKDMPKVVKISIGSPFPEYLNISLNTFYRINASDEGKATARSIFAPTSMYFTSQSNSYSQEVAFISSGVVAGMYDLEFQLGGESSADFDIVYPSGTVFVVLDAGMEPTSPTLKSAQFDNSGMSIVVTFDAATNRGLFSNIFSCVNMLAAIFIDSATNCLWKSDVELLLFSTGVGGAVINDTLTLLPNSTKAKCQGVDITVHSCDDWEYSMSTSISIKSPENVIPPQVSIVAPASIGPCDSLLLDLTGSTGAGGRPFTYISITVESIHPNTSDLNTFLSSVNSIRNPIHVPSAYMYSGFAYNFVAVLCTFLGSCGRASHQLVVSKSMNVPVISVNSDKIRSVYRYSTLSIRGNAHTSECGGSTTSKNLKFEWSMYERNPSTQKISKLTDSRFQSSSADSRVLKLNPFTLDVGGVYSAKLTVTHTESLKSSTFSIDIFVIKGDIVSVLSVPSRMGLRFDSSFHLDAGGSYDEDSDSDDPTENLAYYFECKQLSPTYSNVCDLSLDHTMATGIEVSFQDPSGDEIDNIYELRVVVQHIIDSRFSESFVEITILPANAPKISLTSESSLRINPSQKVKLIGEIEYSSSGYATWDVSDDSVIIDDSPLFDRTKLIAELPSGKSVGVLVMSLVLPPFTLPPQSTFTFSLSCFLSGGDFSNVASITLTTNSPPQPGLFIIIPKNGTMLETTFSFSAAEWEDVDRPMSYDFGYRSNSGAYTVSRSRLEVSYFVTSSLPSGIANADYNLSVRLQVFDILNAKAVALETIRVVEGEQLSVDDMQSLFSTGIEDSNGFSDGIKEVVATVSNLVNKVNCSGAPDCFSLGREECSTIAGTCGECLPDFVGDNQPSNDPCFRTNENARGANAELFQVCDDAGECHYPSKTCPSDCSGRGDCVYVSPQFPNVSYSNCTVVDFHCITKCSCFHEYGGVACESSYDDFIGFLDTRDQIVQAIRNISLLDDPTSESLSSWLHGLADVCSNPVGLHTTTKVLMSELAIEFIGTARLLQLPYEDLDSVRLTLDLVLSALVEDSSGVPADLLDAYATFISNDMVQGQNNVAVSGATYRIASYALDGSTNVTCNVPQSSLEGILDLSPQSVVIPESTTTQGYRFSLIELSAPMTDSNDYLSAPLGLRFSSSPCNFSNTDESCSVLVTLQYSKLTESIPFDRNATNGTFFTCEKDIVENKTFVCPDGETLSVQCNGTAGSVYQQCPYYSFSKSCQSIGRDRSSCALESFTPNNITCSCMIYSPGRRALEESSDDSEISIDFVTAGTSILHEFTATWRSVGDLALSDIVGSWEVLLTLGLLAIVSGVLLFLSWREDEMEVKRLKRVAALNDVEVNTTAAIKLLLDGKMRRKVIQGASHKPFDHQQSRSAHETLNSALPSVLQPTPLWVKCGNELKLYHRWAGIYFHYSKSYTRPLRLLVLLTNVVLFIFVDALTYDLRDPDDGQCELELSYDSCLAEPSTLSAGESKCYWNDDTSSCHIRETDNSLSQILTVAIFASLIGTPFAIVIQVLIQKYLAAETSKPSRVLPSSHGEVSPTSSRRRRGSHDFSAISPQSSVRVSPLQHSGSFSGRQASILPVHDSGDQQAPDITDSENKDYWRNIHEEVPMFYADIRRFRKTLNKADRKVFDRVWGLSDDIDSLEWNKLLRSVYEVLQKMKKFLISRLTKTKSGSSEVILLENLKRVHEATRREMSFFDSSMVSEARKNRRLIFLFVKDLLGSANGKILESKERRDNRRAPAVSFKTKVFVWGIILLTLGGMLFYVYLFAMRQTASRQSSWFKTFMIWLLFELLLVSSAVVLVTHVLIPSFVLSDLNKVREKVIADIRAYRKSIDSHLHEKKYSLLESGEVCNVHTAREQEQSYVEEVTANQDFNAAKYLFVSNHVARAFPKLPISGSVLSYSTQWPQQSMTSEKRLSDNYNAKFNFILQSASRIGYFFLLGVIQFPEPVQDCIVELVSTSGLGYFVIFLVSLYQISPLIVLVPVVLIVMSIHFIIASSKSSFLLTSEEPTSSKVAPDKSSQDDDAMSSSIENVESTLQRTTRNELVHDSAELSAWDSKLDMAELTNLEMECRNEMSKFMSQCHIDEEIDSDEALANIMDRADELFCNQVRSVRDRMNVWDQVNSEVSSERIIGTDKSEESGDACRNNTVDFEDKYNDLKDDEILQVYIQNYEKAEESLLHFLIHVKGEPAEDFEYNWDENSDEYRYLYQDDVVPFIDKQGNQVTAAQIVMERLRKMKEDIDLYNWNRKLATESVTRRRRAAAAWDSYRMYDSDLILPFIDDSGQYFSESIISKIRKEHGVSTQQGNISNEFHYSLNRLYQKKQLAEYNLMTYTQKLTREQKSLFLSQQNDQFH